MTNENTDSSNCCDSSWRRTAPDGAGWSYAVIGERVKVGPETVLRACGAGGTDRNCANQIFPGAIGLEPQDLKYDGSKTQVKLVTATDSGVCHR